MAVFPPAETIILGGVLVALVLFVRMAIKAGTVRSFQFQLSAFLVVWAISEIPRYLDSMGILDLTPIRLYGLVIHMISMILFAFFIIFRFSKFVVRAGT
jgi:hypothetical protein